MRRRIATLFVCLLAFVYLAAACGGGGGMAREAPTGAARVITERVEVSGGQVAVTRVVTEEVAVEFEAEEPEAESMEESAVELLAATPSPAGTRPASNRQVQRMIIKDGDMAITVADTDAAVAASTNEIVELGGYIINQHVYDSDAGYRFATVQFGVPVERFEEAMAGLRTLGQVTSESASGQDVTDEYVDLNSRLGNLLATQDRLRSFLLEAQNVAEILAINEELEQIEEELEIIQGRMAYLADRAAFSTIDLDLSPMIPTATPTATSTPTPIPTPHEWRPGDTAQTAFVRLQNTAQNTADFTIYNSITCGPWLLLLSLFAYLTWQAIRLAQRRLHRPPPAPQPGNT
ncbi:MAG: DUF4349 domain-containing protein, partial [Chloroflexi bacterium]|nr:DUF4349 domain-containing protein [Chloroflexota bacterium]